jgi:hypothetical protein
MRSTSVRSSTSVTTRLGCRNVNRGVVTVTTYIDKEFANEPDIAAEVHHRFGDFFNSFGNSFGTADSRTHARFHARRAYDLRRQFYGPKHELVAKDMFYLAVTNEIPRENKPEFMVEAMQMMRETNPLNLNFPYMVEDYVSRLMLPMY